MSQWAWPSLPMPRSPVRLRPLRREPRTRRRRSCIAALPRACGSTVSNIFANAAAAQDLVQQVFVVTIERLRRGEVRNPASIGSFILSASRIVATDLRRTHERRERLTDTFIDRTTAVAPKDEALDTERVERCLSALPSRDRALLVLTFYAEKKASENRIESPDGAWSGACRTPSRAGAAPRLCSEQARRRQLCGIEDCGWERVTMTGEQCAGGASFADLLDYWVGDLDQASAERVEAHVFECSECADRLADISTIAAAVAEAVRGARVQSIVTDAVLNKLSREGVRVRTYALEAGTFVPCAIWPEDDLVVSRLKGDFSGYDELTLVLKADEGRELSRNTEIPLLSGTHEIITATSAVHLRQLPSMRLRMIVSGKRGGAEHVIAEYGLEHGGAMSR